MSFELEIEKLSLNYTLEDAYEQAGVEAVVWNREDTLKTKNLDYYDLEATPGEYTYLKAIQVTADPDASVNLGSRKSAWIVEIYPVEGDVLIEDARGPVVDKYGNEIPSKILITSRKLLVEDEDFVYIREVTLDDLAEDEEEEYEDFAEFHDYGLDDDDEE